MDIKRIQEHIAASEHLLSNLADDDLGPDDLYAVATAAQTHSQIASTLTALAMNASLRELLGEVRTERAELAAASTPVAASEEPS